jgi:undecaprenyl-diphosphatase
MLDLFYSIVLGAIQGITEFLPISSSGHLIIFRDFLGINVAHGLAFDAVLQLATALAVLVYFRKDLWDILRSVPGLWKLDSRFSNKIQNRESRIENLRLLKWLVIATIPAVIIGLLLQDYMETTFRSTLIVAGALIVGSLIMFYSEKFIKVVGNLNVPKSLIVGLFQSLALIPGMSRAGMTISGGYFMGLSKEFAIKFSFLLSVPIIIGSGAIKLRELVMNAELINQIGLQLIFGSISAFVFGLLAIDFLIKFLKKNTFKWFIVYRIALALLLIVLVL